MAGTITRITESYKAIEDKDKEMEKSFIYFLENSLCPRIHYHVRSAQGNGERLLGACGGACLTFSEAEFAIEANSSIGCFPSFILLRQSMICFVCLFLFLALP